MTQEELIDFLRKNLKILVEINAYSIDVSLFLCQELISKSTSETDTRL